MVLLFLGRSWWALGASKWDVYGAPNIIFKPYRTLPLYSRTEPNCRLPCQTSAKNISLNSTATCAIMVQTLCQDDVALYVSPCCADIERNRSKKGGFFLQETLCVCVCMPALAVAVLIAYDYECARKLSASLFLGSQKQAFLASWLWALIVYIYICKVPNFVTLDGDIYKSYVFFTQR